MSGAEFDAWEEDYERALDAALEITGFDGDHFVRYKLATLKRLLPRFVNRPFELLDFGCGPGSLRAHVHESLPQARYTGVDPSTKMIERAARRFPHEARFHTLDSDAWKRQSYDLIFVAGVFHHIPHAEHARVLRSLVAILAPEGALAIWEHNPLNPFTRKIVSDCAFDRGAVLVSARGMRRRLLEAELAGVRIHYVTFFPRPLSVLLPLERHLGWLSLGGQYVAIGERR